MSTAASRPGYAFLVTVLIIGAVSTAVVTSLLLLATSSVKSTLSLQQSAGAFSYARTCAERAIRSMRADGNYGGNETVSFSDGSCRVLTVGGIGNGQRTLCTEGTVGGVTRRVEIVLGQLLPSASVLLWREVADFTLC